MVGAARDGLKPIGMGGELEGRSIGNKNASLCVCHKSDTSEARFLSFFFFCCCCFLCVFSFSFLFSFCIFFFFFFFFFLIYLFFFLSFVYLCQFR